MRAGFIGLVVPRTVFECFVGHLTSEHGAGHMISRAVSKSVRVEECNGILLHVLGHIARRAVCRQNIRKILIVPFSASVGVEVLGVWKPPLFPVGAVRLIGTFPIGIGETKCREWIRRKMEEQKMETTSECGGSIQY